GDGRADPFLERRLRVSQVRPLRLRCRDVRELQVRELPERALLLEIVLERRLLRIAKAVLERPEQRERSDRQRRNGRDEYYADDPTAQTKSATARLPEDHYGPRNRYPAPRTVRM